MGDGRLYDDPTLKPPVDFDKEIERKMAEGLDSLMEGADNLKKFSEGLMDSLERSKRMAEVFDRMLTELVVIRTQVVEMNEREKLREFRANAMEAPEPNLKKG